MPPLDLDRFELDSDDDNDIDAWCDDFWNLGTPRQRLEPIITRIGRSLEEILELEVELINSHTELDPESWIRIYAERYRQLLTDDPTLTNFEVKHRLYLQR